MTPAENKQTVEAALGFAENVARYEDDLLWIQNVRDARAALRDLVAQAAPNHVAISDLDWCIGYATAAENEEWGTRLVEKLTEVRARLDGAR